MKTWFDAQPLCRTNRIVVARFHGHTNDGRWSMSPEDALEFAAKIQSSAQSVLNYKERGKDKTQKESD